MSELSPEQQAVVNAPLAPLSVVACAGSGKTLTAVHRLLEIRKRLGNQRGRIALLSFSNVAVKTFRNSYSALAQTLPPHVASSRVEIDTLDGFFTTNVLRPHAYRTMASKKAAFLVTGDEPFLKAFTYWTGEFPLNSAEIKVGIREGQPYFYYSYHEQRMDLDLPSALSLITRLGKTGAYTHELGRYWCYRTLSEQPGILRALSKRYPHILIDESQDIGSVHQAILDLLDGAGVQISLIGDPNQGIYEFAGADGRYLSNYATRPGRSHFSLTTNYRSVPPILTVANTLSTREDIPHRTSPENHHGAFFITYHTTDTQLLIDTFQNTIGAAGLSASNSAIVCRGRKLAAKLTGANTQIGQGSVKEFAHAAILRDKRADFLAAFKIVAGCILSLLSAPPQDLLAQINQPALYPNRRALRRELWAFTRDAASGLPSSTLIADTEWHPRLVTRVKALLSTLRDKHGLLPANNIGQKLAKKKLPNQPLTPADDQMGIQQRSIRVETVHQVKGESLDAVLYLAEKKHIRALIEGVDSEVGRIGYVAVTRAKDLFWLAVPDTCIKDFRAELIARGFQEAGAVAGGQ